MKAWILFVLATIVCWGLYGPIIHEGQLKLNGSAVSAFFCVGLAYFLIAFLITGGVLVRVESARVFNGPGVTVAMIAGALGALGALGVIYAFKAGGKPFYVMPLVFGGAPLVNVLYSVWRHPPKESPHPLLYLGFALAIVGAGLVLGFKPKG